jgi:hypothetical protein
VGQEAGVKTRSRNLLPGGSPQHKSRRDESLSMRQGEESLHARQTAVELRVVVQCGIDLITPLFKVPA